MNNCTRKRSPNQDEFAILPLIKPGSRGWKNPQVNSDISLKHDLTTEEINRHLGIPLSYLKRCHVGEVGLWKTCLIWHKGRDRWELYEKLR